MTRPSPLSQWSLAPRAWAGGFLLLAGLGLFVSIYYVHASASLKLEGLASRFSGPETDAIAQHSFLSLLQTTHTHLFTLAFLQLALGGFFLLSSAPERLKPWLAGGSFLLIAADHAAMWLAFSRGPAFAPLIMACGTALTLSLAVQTGWCLYDLGNARKTL